MTTTSVKDAANAQVARRENGPGQMLDTYRGDLQLMMPTHVKPETWIRIAQGALKKGRIDRGTGKYELEVAAANNVGAFMAAVSEAARLGLEPGTEEYYLTPRKVKGRLEILGIVGYQGLIELMYRAGAVASVVAETVYEHDTFTYQPGTHRIPNHEIDWDSDDRGKLRLVYAYAWMRDGSVSKVVVLNRAAIDRIKESSQGSSSDYSPWVKHEPSMWLKSAVRQLSKWVPTSAEYRQQPPQTPVQVTAAQVVDAPALAPAPIPVDDSGVEGYVDEQTGEISDSDPSGDDEGYVHEGEIVDDPWATPAGGDPS